MKEVAVEVETGGEDGEFEDQCVLETLVKRVRRERRI